MLWYLMACAVIAALLLDQCERERLMQVSIDALDKENARLRELVRDIWYAYRCEEVATNVAKHWHDRMREVGVDA